MISLREANQPLVSRKVRRGHTDWRVRLLDLQSGSCFPFRHRHHQRCFYRNSRLLQCIYASWRSRDEKQLYASLSLLPIAKSERSISLFDRSREIRMEGRLPCCLCWAWRGACRLSGVCARLSSNRGRELTIHAPPSRQERSVGHRDVHIRSTASFRERAHAFVAR